MIEHIDIVRKFIDSGTTMYCGTFAQENERYAWTIDFLLSLFVGIRKVSIDRCFKLSGRNLSKAVVLILEALVVRDPALCLTMLSLGPREKFTYNGNGLPSPWYVPMTYKQLNSCFLGTIQLHIMKCW